jgi:glycosyltransferase involved in cell wall biosynthesis
LSYLTNGMKKIKQVKVTIFVPCYNMGAYIGDALQSVYAQTYKDYEIIIVDDGSADEYTLKQLKNISKRHPEIRIYYKENSGLSGAKNYGIERANGEYIVCLDADDRLESTYLEKTVKLMDQKKSDKVAFVTTWVQEFGLRNDIWQTSGFDMPKLLITNVVHAGSIFRKDVWEEVGGFKKVGASYEDWEFWINIVEKGYKWDIVEEVLFFYRIRKNSLLASAKSSHIEIYKTNYGLHPQIYKQYAKELVIENAREIKELREVISEKNKAIEAYTQAVDYHKKQAASLEEEIRKLYGSRITHLALKLIAVSVFLRTKLPALKNRLKRFLRDLAPSFAKRLIRRGLDMVFPKKIVMVYNKKWPSEKPLVSVITPFYNQATSIKETAQSVFNQTYKDIEYIIVDDGSKEEEARELDAIKDKRLKVIRNKENIGKGSPAAARNEGIKHASGKYVVCLDGDDMLAPTYIEKAIIALEFYPSTSLVTTDKRMFGAMNEPVSFVDYDPLELINDNMVVTAAMYKREAWEATGGYKTGIGYEDWEFWISMAEKGFFGKHLPEKLFLYRTAYVSRYVEDKKKHQDNVRMIRSLHPEYKHRVKQFLKTNRKLIYQADPETIARNLTNVEAYKLPPNKNKSILFALPWMTFGGAETLVVNFCNEIKDDFNISFVTGIDSAHEWEYRFSEFTDDIYHLPKLFRSDTHLYIEFISNYITTRGISILHIVHTSFMFSLLPEIRKRHPELRIVVTQFNDRAHFEESLEYEDYINGYTSDNSAVANHYGRKLLNNKNVTVIPNGVNCYGIFNPDLFNREIERNELGIGEDDIAIFFVGRLSEEKNPDVFLEAAKKHINDYKTENIKFFVIGDGPMREEVEKRIADIDNPNVQYLGYQSDIAKYLSTADIFVLPSAIEGFPLSILEAMAMNVVVIASDVGAVPEIIDSGNNGFVVTPGSSEEITEIINQLKHDKSLLAKIKINARTKIEKKYSNTILGENYRKLYKELLK